MPPVQGVPFPSASSALATFSIDSFIAFRADIGKEFASRLVFSKSKQSILVTQIRFNLEPAPFVLQKRFCILEGWSITVEQGESDEIGFPFPQAKEVLAGQARLVLDVLDKRSIENFADWMIQLFCECPKNRQVCRSLQVKNESGLFRQIELVKADFPERLQNLASAIIYAMRATTDKRNHNVSTRSFVQENFGMACRDDLAAVLTCNIRQHLIDLALAKYFQVCIRLIEEEYRRRIRVEMGEK